MGKGTASQCWSTKTESGKQCQYWNLDYPHSHDYNSEGSHNFCRNPDNAEKPWCYTTDSSKRWEYCDCPTTYNTNKLASWNSPHRQIGLSDTIVAERISMNGQMQNVGTHHASTNLDYNI